jgi:ABC-2 type transport system ATP-binding protein
MSEVMIKAESLTKHFGPLVAVSDVSFEIERGKVVAFLGPNGAGKSTTMRMLTGFIAPTQGRAMIGGVDVVERRREAVASVGYLPENGPLYGDMTPRSLLTFFGSVRGLAKDRIASRIDAVIEQCSLQAVIDRPIGKLSRGYRQRVGVAQALLHDPAVMILDEPTAALDPNQIRQVRQLIRELGRSKTILLSTHILQEVEAVADHVIFIHAGKIVFDGTIDDFRKDTASLDERFQSLTTAA